MPVDNLNEHLSNAWAFWLLTMCVRDTLLSPSRVGCSNILFRCSAHHYQTSSPQVSMAFIDRMQTNDVTITSCACAVLWYKLSCENSAALAASKQVIVYYCACLLQGRSLSLRVLHEGKVCLGSMLRMSRLFFIVPEVELNCREH